MSVAMKACPLTDSLRTRILGPHGLSGCGIALDPAPSPEPVMIAGAIGSLSFEAFLPLSGVGPHDGKSGALTSHVGG